MARLARLRIMTGGNRRLRGAVPEYGLRDDADLFTAFLPAGTSGRLGYTMSPSSTSSTQSWAGVLRDLVHIPLACGPRLAGGYGGTVPGGSCPASRPSRSARWIPMFCPAGSLGTQLGAAGSRLALAADCPARGLRAAGVARHVPDRAANHGLVVTHVATGVPAELVLA